MNTRKIVEILERFYMAKNVCIQFEITLILEFDCYSIAIVLCDDGSNEIFYRSMLEE